MYEWAGVILRPGPLSYHAYIQSWSGWDAVTIGLEGAETTWPGLFLLLGFLRQSRDLGDDMRSFQKISKNLQNFVEKFFQQVYNKNLSI